MKKTKTINKSDISGLKQKSAVIMHEYKPGKVQKNTRVQCSIQYYILIFEFFEENGSVLAYDGNCGCKHCELFKMS